MEMSESNFKLLIAKQKWKFVMCGVWLLIAGIGFLATERLSVVFSIPAVLINFGADAVVLLVLIGAVLSIRCPKCGLSLVWFAITTKSIGGWISWLFEVNTCPRCGFHDGGNEAPSGAYTGGDCKSKCDEYPCKK